jgi:hypothetical protein
MSAIGVAYSTYNVVFDQFTGGEIARTFDGSASFTRGVSGQQVLAGNSARQKYVWAVSGLLTEADAVKVDEMFQAWDLDRASGQTAAIGVTDQTFGAAVITAAIFSTPPSFIRTGPLHYTVAFGLTEV